MLKGTLCLSKTNYLKKCSIYIILRSLLFLSSQPLHFACGPLYFISDRLKIIYKKSKYIFAQSFLLSNAVKRAALEHLCILVKSLQEVVINVSCLSSRLLLPPSDFLEFKRYFTKK